MGQKGVDIGLCVMTQPNYWDQVSKKTQKKVKNYYWDLAEKAVDAILLELTNNAISKEAAKAKIMVLDNLELVGIDENNIDEVIDMELESA